MKTISDALQNHLDGDTRLAILVKITRIDGTIKAFTTFDRDLVVEGTTYKADGGFSFEDLENVAALKTNSYEGTGLLDSDQISDEDLRSGYYDHARIDIGMCNWQDVSQGVISLRRGWLGEVAISGGLFKAEFRGLQDLLQRKVGTVYAPECRHDLGDSLCGLAIATGSGNATTVVNNAVFYDTNNSFATTYFNNGLLTWTGGANKGLSMEVKNWDAANFIFTLWLPMPNEIVVGDTYTVTAGCDKQFSTCKNKFGNVTNFGGFPHLPGLAKILQYPESS